MANDDTYIIGFDLGDGESCLAYVNSDSLDEPLVFRSQNESGSIPSAIAEYPIKFKMEIGIVIGEDALLRENRTDLNINFKWNPVEKPEQWRLRKDKVLLFAEKFYEGLAQKHPDITENCEIYIGCPSGWSEESRHLYKELFQGSNVLPVSRLDVVPESRSALIQAWDCKTLPPDLINEKVLLIDIGSSTTDVTVIDNLDTCEIEVGQDLGLRLVDANLIYTLCKRHPRGDWLANLIDKNTVNSALLLYTCRLAKEQAFGRKVNPTNLFSDRDWLEECWKLLLSFDLKNCLQSDFFWDKDPWLERYRRLLHELRDSENVGEPSVVIVTGGGSNIELLVEEAGATFPNAHLVRAPEPAYAIARGLAGYGRWHKRVQKFLSEAKALVKNTPFETKLSVELSQFTGTLIESFIISGTEAIWRPIAYQWKGGTFDLKNRDGLLSYVRQLHREWLEEGGKSVFEPALASLSHAVNSVLYSDIRHLGERYGLSVNDFKIEVHLTPLDLFAPGSFGGALINKAVWGMHEILFRTIDAVPETMRHMVPDIVLDMALKLEDLNRRILGTLVSATGDTFLSSKGHELLIRFVRDAADAEIERQILHIKKLLLIKYNDYPNISERRYSR